MELFVVGIVVGYALFPLSELAGRWVAQRWDSVADGLRTAKRCRGNCDQGRRACDCEVQ